MPFPRTWSEELIAEWLQLKGYFVEVGIPIRSGQKGGRSEADIVGAKVIDDRLEIFHIEVGSLSGNPKSNAETIQEKFSEGRKNAIKRYCRDRLEFSSSRPTSYKELYVAVWWSDKTLLYLKQQQLPVIALLDLIKDEIRPTIQKWKNQPPHQPQTRGKSVTLPQNMWLLYLLDYIME